MVDPAQVAEAISERTNVVSIMLANNEVGTIEPVAEIGAAIRERARHLGRDIVFHTDAAQAGGVLDLNVEPTWRGHADFGGPQVLRAQGYRDPVRP